MSSRRITIFDRTLRDGEQALGMALGPIEKVNLDEDELVAAFARFKARADQRGAVSIHELVQEVSVS